jgi:hypothetical protein
VKVAFLFRIMYPIRLARMVDQIEQLTTTIGAEQTPSGLSGW